MLFVLSVPEAPNPKDKFLVCANTLGHKALSDSDQYINIWVLISNIKTWKGVSEERAILPHLMSELVAGSA